MLQPDAEPYWAFLGKALSQSAVLPKTTISLCTLRYIHGNPKAAGMKQGFFYDFSNYGTYDQLTTDGLTEWHPAFLALDNSLDECAAKYRGFYKRYKPQPKGKKRSAWGSKMLPVLPKSKPKKNPASGQVVRGCGKREIMR